MCTVAGHWSHAQFPLHSYYSYQWLSIPLPFFSLSNELTAFDLVISHLWLNGLLLLRQRSIVLAFHGLLTASFFLSILAIPPPPSLSPSTSPHPLHVYTALHSTVKPSLWLPFPKFKSSLPSTTLESFATDLLVVVASSRTLRPLSSCSIRSLTLSLTLTLTPYLRASHNLWWILWLQLYIYAIPTLS